MGFGREAITKGLHKQTLEDDRHVHDLERDNGLKSVYIG